MTLQYLHLLSAERIRIEHLGALHSPTLREIVRLGPDVYQNYLNFLSLDLYKYLELFDLKQQYEAASEEEKQQLSLFRIITANEKLCALYASIFSFFIDGSISYDAPQEAYLITEIQGDAAPNGVSSGRVAGRIDNDNYDTVRNLLLQLNYIQVKGTDLSKCKNKKALEIAEKLRKGREQFYKHKGTSRDMNLANMISALCVQHSSYNLLNVWDLTIYQLYDQFFRQNMKTQIDVTSLRWAAWGKDPFDFSLWYKSLKEN